MGTQNPAAVVPNLLTIRKEYDQLPLMARIDQNPAGLMSNRLVGSVPFVMTGSISS